MEYAFAPAWSVKVEYKHFDFGTETATLNTLANGNFRIRNDLTADAVMVGRIITSGTSEGLSYNLVTAYFGYKFDMLAPPTPVVAKY